MIHILCNIKHTVYPFSPLEGASHCGEMISKATVLPGNASILWVGLERFTIKKVENERFRRNQCVGIKS